jgi:hypothetical protein
MSRSNRNQGGPPPQREHPAEPPTPSPPFAPPRDRTALIVALVALAGSHPWAKTSPGLWRLGLEKDHWSRPLDLSVVSLSLFIESRSKDRTPGDGVLFMTFVAVYGLAALGRMAFLMIGPGFI